MKKLFLMLAAAAAVASCSKDYTIVADQGEAIEFGSFVENSTRATEATDPSYSTSGNGVALTQFNVYGAVGGVNIFNGNLVTKSADYGSAWTLDGTKQYWINGANYEFVAVVDGNKSVTVDETTTVITETTTNASGIPTSITYNSDGATDLLCARVVRNADVNGNTDTSLVGFEFTHLLSKVMFSVTNTTDDDATNYRIVLTEAKITGALASNTYVVGATSNWTAVSQTPTTKDFTLENLTIDSDATQYHSTELLLLPGVNVGVTVTANVEAKANGTDWTPVSTISKTFENVLGAGNTLVANNAYHFAVTLGIGTEIQFTATQMPEWVDGDGNDDTPLQ